MKGSGIIIAIIVSCIVVTLCSCARYSKADNTTTEIPGIPEIQQTEEKEENEMSEPLVSVQELLQFINDNPDRGLTEADFKGIDIEDFIKTFYLTVEGLDKYAYSTTLSLYKEDKEREKRASIVAKGIYSVDSTDEEYCKFVETYLEAVGRNNRYIGENSTYGTDAYEITGDDDEVLVYIGKTKDIAKLDISESGFYGTYEIQFPVGDMVMSTEYFYSNDYKFFIIVGNSMNDDFSYELAKIFTKVSLP